MVNWSFQLRAECRHLQWPRRRRLGNEATAEGSSRPGSKLVRASLQKRPGCRRKGGERRRLSFQAGPLKRRRRGLELCGSCRELDPSGVRVVDACWSEAPTLGAEADPRLPERLTMGASAYRESDDSGALRSSCAKRSDMPARNRFPQSGRVPALAYRASPAPSRHHALTSLRRPRPRRNSRPLSISKAIRSGNRPAPASSGLRPARAARSTGRPLTSTPSSHLASMSSTSTTLRQDLSRGIKSRSGARDALVLASPRSPRSARQKP